MKVIELMEELDHYIENMEVIISCKDRTFRIMKKEFRDEGKQLTIFVKEVKNG